jgi:alpha-beta hydrolase superfamily lysophospholipase
MPTVRGNPAILNDDAIDDIRKKYADEMTMVDALDWYLAGHSLGGVAAADYLADRARHEEKDLVAGFKGLILCASYPADSLADTNLRLLSILGSNDGVINKDKYEEAKALWPENSTERVIEGGIHSYFGSYGIQEGDGEPQITNLQQLDMTARIIHEWISQ